MNDGSRRVYDSVRDAEAASRVSGAQKLVEPTSGNTGLALAMVSNAKGYSLTTPLSKQIPIRRIHGVLRRALTHCSGRRSLEADAGDAYRWWGQDAERGLPL